MKKAMALSTIALSAIFSSAAAISPIAVVTTSGLPPGRCAKPPPGSLARVDEMDATRLVEQRSSHVIEHPQPAVGCPERRGLSRAGRETTVRILLRGRIRGRLGKIGGGLGARTWTLTAASTASASHGHDLSETSHAPWC